jgi:ketosteroid isomerase-like protein
VRTEEGISISERQDSMDKLVAPRKVLLVLPLLAFGLGQANAQEVPPLDRIKSQEDLNKAILSLDARLFDAYNRCDLEKFAAFFVDDVEFYHDQGGVTLGKQELTNSVKKNICGKVTRELVPSSLQIYQMKGYGAVEMGVHRFHHPGHDDTEPVGEGKFIHLWQYKDGAWKITRVISYDHHAAAK